MKIGFRLFLCLFKLLHLPFLQKHAEKFLVFLVHFNSLTSLINLEVILRCPSLILAYEKFDDFQLLLLIFD